MTTSPDPWAPLTQLLETLPIDVRQQAELLRTLRDCRTAVEAYHQARMDRIYELERRLSQMVALPPAPAIADPYVPEPPRLQLAEAHDTPAPRKSTLAKKATAIAASAKKKLHRS